MSERIICNDNGSERIICNDNGGELREEIVRCRDCKYASYDIRWCYRLTISYEPPITPDDFCAWGERR